MNSPTVAVPPAQKRWALPKVGNSLFDSLFPNSNIGHRAVAVIACVLLMFLCAKLRFYLPDNPTPVTMQTFGVLLTGGIMGWRWGLIAVLVYVGLGALGLPVLANQDPAFGLRSPADAWNNTILGATGGYIIGFAFAAALTGLLTQIGLVRASSLWAIAFGGLALYAPALIWIELVGPFCWTAESGEKCWPSDSGKLFQQAMYVFMPGDILKILSASILLTGLWKFADNPRSGRRQRDA